MSYEILTVLLVVFLIGLAIYIIKFNRPASGATMTGAILNKVNPKREKKRQELAEKERAWAKTLENMPLNDLYNERSKLIKRNSQLMKTGRDMKIIEAREELQIRQRIVEEKIRTMNGR